MRCLQAVRCSLLSPCFPRSILCSSTHQGWVLSHLWHPVEQWDQSLLSPCSRGAGVGDGHPSAPSLQGTRRCLHHRPEGQEMLKNVKNALPRRRMQNCSRGRGLGDAGRDAMSPAAALAQGCFPSVCIAIITPWGLCPPPPGARVSGHVCDGSVVTAGIGGDTVRCLTHEGA